MRDIFPETANRTAFNTRGMVSRSNRAHWSAELPSLSRAKAIRPPTRAAEGSNPEVSPLNGCIA